MRKIILTRKNFIALCVFFGVAAIFISYLNVSVLAMNTEKSALSEQYRVKIGMLNNECKPDNLPYLVAEKKGYFKSENIIVDKAESMSGIAFGDSGAYQDFYDILVTGRAQFYFMQATQPDKYKAFIANVNTINKPDYSILVKKGSDIKNISDLREKKVGLQRSSGKARFVLMDMILEKKGFNPKDFHVQDADTEDLRKGNVDALYIREPQLSLAIQNGDLEKIDDAMIVKYIMDPWPQGFYSLSGRFIEKHGDLARGVVNSLSRAVDFIQENPDEARKILQECVADEYRVENSAIRIFEYWNVSDFNKDAIQKQIDLYHDKSLIPSSFPVDDIILN